MYDATETQGTSAQVLHHCPHCQGRFEIHTDSSAREVFCPLCGKGFDPVKVETIHYPEGTPVALSPCAPAETVTSVDKDEKIPNGTLLGQYRVDGFLGRGGMGAVYRATQTSLDRAVALKVLPRHMAEDAEFVQRFHREAKALAELNHPHIVAIHDRGEADGLCFFAMEYVNGTSLRRLLASRSVDPSRALRIASEVCDALGYAHGRGVIHRDIKPENLLVDRSGRVKIADFGLARIVRGNATPSEGLTRSDVVMGTLDYMAPEQRDRTKDADARADLYALGVVLYEMLTGELPLGRFEPPSRRAQVDPRLDDVVMRLLDRDPATRIQRAEEARALLEGIASTPGQVSPVRPESIESMWARFWGRGRLVADPLLIGVLLSFVGFVLVDKSCITTGAPMFVAGGILAVASCFMARGSERAIAVFKIVAPLATLLLAIALAIDFAVTTPAWLARHPSGDPDQREHYAGVVVAGFLGAMGLLRRLRPGTPGSLRSAGFCLIALGAGGVALTFLGTTILERVHHTVLAMSAFLTAATLTTFSCWIRSRPFNR